MPILKNNNTVIQNNNKIIDNTVVVELGYTYVSAGEGIRLAFHSTVAQVYRVNYQGVDYYFNANVVGVGFDFPLSYFVGLSDLPDKTANGTLKIYISNPNAIVGFSVRSYNTGVAPIARSRITSVSGLYRLINLRYAGFLFNDTTVLLFPNSLESKLSNLEKFYDSNSFFTYEFPTEHLLKLKFFSVGFFGRVSGLPDFPVGCPLEILETGVSNIVINSVPTSIVNCINLNILLLDGAINSIPNLATLPLTSINIALRSTEHDTYFDIPFSVTTLILRTNAPGAGYSSAAYSLFTDYIFINRVLFNTNNKTFTTTNNGYENVSGTYQQPDLGTYASNINDLTEIEIDNLAAGLDYDGLGSNTIWSDREKWWILATLNVSSVVSTKRYKWTANF